ncbi:glutamate racemase [Piscinibacter sp.]|uniref:glutamate racemase n=1 Tax=Piscinibacter sp. TaxID=1903157 RepID=UPI002ED29270
MPCIGVFDSGVGGLSVLRALQERLPRTPLLYVADSGHAPYGERSEGYIVERSTRIAAHLLDQGAAAVVVACNTATAVAVRHLRERWPHCPIVGVEPGLKPAAALSRNGRIGVMATPGTLASEKFRLLVRAQAQALSYVLQPCPGLARLIEEGDLDAASLREAIADHTRPLVAAGVDTVVLGCTHYGFVRRHIQAALGPQVQIVDTAEPVARQAARLSAPVVPEMPAPSIRLQTTGEVERLRAIAKAWLPFDCEVESVGGGG